jgi:hypothetical protein
MDVSVTAPVDHGLPAVRHMPDGPTRGQRRLRILVYLGLSLAYLVWRQSLSVAVFTFANHDDALFWGQAGSILRGDWLGPYNNLTLSKGPGFSFVLAANHLSGLSITLTLALLYLLGCAAVTRELVRSGMNSLLAMVVFALMLFHPAVVPGRVIRDDIYAAVTLIAIAGALRVWRSDSGRARSLLVTALWGSGLGLFWVTREEGVWAVPGLALLIGFALLAARRDREVLRRRLLHTTAYLCAALGVVALVSSINFAVYGKFLVTDFKDPAFSSAVKVLNSVQVGRETPFVPVPERKRKVAYQVSPAFRELRSVLEDPANHWKANGDFPGSWWVWALRDAVAERGYYTSPDAAAAYYDRVDREVSAACDEGRITCRSNPLPFMPNVEAGQLKAIPATTWRALALLTVQDGYGGVEPSLEPRADLEEVRDFLGDPLTSPTMAERRKHIRGWYHAPDRSWITLSCVRASGKEFRQGIPRLASPELVAQLGDPAASASAFSIVVPPRTECSVMGTSSGSTAVSLTTPLVTPGSAYTLGGESQLSISSVDVGVPRPNLSTRIQSALASLYGRVLPPATVVGALAFMLALLLKVTSRRRRRSHLLIPALALWTLLAGRVLTLVLVEISSFYAVNPLYMSAGFPLLILAVGASVQALTGGRLDRGVDGKVSSRTLGKHGRGTPESSPLPGG